MVNRILIHEHELHKLESGQGQYRGVAHEMHRRAELVLAKAQADAPVRSGEYRAGLHIEEIVVDGVLQVRVAGGSDHDVYVEASTGNLVRALDAGGGST